MRANRRTTMRKKRHTPEEIVSKLRQVDVLVAQGSKSARRPRVRRPWLGPSIRAEAEATGSEKAHACRMSKSMTGLTKPMHGQRRHDGAHEQGEELVGLGRAGLHELGCVGSNRLPVR